MTCFLLHVILNAVKNPTEKVRGIYAVLYSKGLPRSLTLNMTDYFTLL